MNLNDLNNSLKPLEGAGMMPAFFIGHGSPMNAIEENPFSRTWKDLGNSIPKPSAILAISAHWETAGTFVTAMERPKTIHDFGGFPRKLYEVEYQAPGNPRLANELSTRLVNHDVRPDHSWGLDHGTWSILKNIYPEAGIPVIQLSIDYRKSPLLHYEMALELAEFRKKGVLIIGSGNLVHNLGMVDWSKIDEPEFGYDWALEADRIFKKLIADGKNNDLANYKSLGRAAQMAVPTPDHFIPMLYALALRQKGDDLTFFNDKAMMGSLTMTSFRIG